MQFVECLPLKEKSDRAYLELKNCIYSPHQKAGIGSPTGIPSKTMP